MSPTPEEVELLARRTAAVRQLQQFEPYFDSEEVAILKPIFDCISGGGGLPPEMAVQGWIRLFELRRFRRRLERMSEGKSLT